MRQPLEYGSRALVGIVTPQANATVEPELGILMGPDVGIVNARLTCPAPDLRARLEAGGWPRRRLGGRGRLTGL